MVYTSTGFILAVTVILTQRICCENQEFGEVVFSTIIYRHGVRTPVELYPNDPHKNVPFWSIGLGQLTQDGMRGHFELGKWFRKRYSSLLPMEYNQSDIYVQTTDVDRTRMSAYCNLAGLYEPDPSKNWNKEVLRHPIPVHTVPSIAQKVPCPRRQELEYKLLMTYHFIKLYIQYKPYLDALSEATGSPLGDFSDVYEVYQTLIIEEYHGLPLPSWSKQLYPEPLRTMSAILISIPAYTQEMARLMSGPILAEMLNHMDDKVSNNSTRKMQIYSAHDTSLVNIMQGLRVFNGAVPPFFSTLMMELRKKDDSYYVTLFFKNTTQGEPHILTMPGCTALCPWEDFKTLIDPVIPENWELECSSNAHSLKTLKLILKFIQQYT